VRRKRRCFLISTVMSCGDESQPNGVEKKKEDEKKKDEEEERMRRRSRRKLVRQLFPHFNHCVEENIDLDPFWFEELVNESSVTRPSGRRKRRARRKETVVSVAAVVLVVIVRQVVEL